MDNNQKAQKIRRLLIERASLFGGHLGASLGTVDIIIALMEVFNFSNDKIVFDIGHQAHAYKILSDREEKFMSLGMCGGISAYPDVKESPYDHYNGGHSGTSVSAALGYAYNNRKYKSIAIVGDGALTTGENFEALNHAGQTNLNVLLVYNDNGMSISSNVGALSNSKNIKKYAQSLNFEYVGIIDGHNIPKMIKLFNKIRRKNHPVFLHVKTIKGKGYRPAELDPERFHYTVPFEINSGQFWELQEKVELTSSEPEDFFERNDRILANYIKKYKKIFFTSPAYIAWGLTNMAKIYPKHVIDVGICEQHCVTFSSALSLGGSKVIMFLASWFLPRCYDQIVDICIQQIPMTIVLLFHGVGTGGASHQGILNHAVLRVLPNLILLHPKSLAEYERMMDYALNANCPVFVQTPDEECTIGEEPELEYGKGAILLTGKKLTVLPIGSTFVKAFMINEIIDDVEILNLRFLKPIDMDLIVKSVKKTKRLAILENGFCKGGSGEEIIAFLSKHNIPCQVRHIGFPDTFPVQGTINEVQANSDLFDEHIIQIVNEMFENKND